MTAFRLLLCGVVLISVAGCARKAEPPTDTSPPPIVATPRPAPPVSSDPPVAAPEDVRGTAEIVARKAKSYAVNVEPTLKPAEGSVASVIDPDQIRLTSAVPSPKPEAPPSANQATALAASVQAGVAPVPVVTTKPAAAISNNPAEAVAITPPVASDELSQRLAARVRDYPQEVAAHLDYQLFQFVQSQPVPQLSSLSSLPGEDRELVTALLDGLSNFRNAVRADNNMLLCSKVRPFLDLADRLRNQAELVIPTVALCKRVDGFGVYDPIEPARFPAGREQPVIVYCEVENFASQIDSQKRWETKLSQEVVLYTEQNGLEVWKDKPTRAMIDLSRNRRHDFFLVKVIHLPANLTIGRYLLKVSVVDEQVKRVAENTVPIQIVAE